MGWTLGNNSLRAGMVMIHEFVIDIDHEKIDGRCLFKGIVGNVFQLVIDKLYHKEISCESIGFTDIGSYNGSSYDGAIGALQRDEIDFLAMPIYYPLIDPDNKLIYSPILYEDTMTILSGYHTTNATHTGDLFSMFTQVPYGLWIGYLMSFFTFVCITFIGSRVLRKHYSSFWMTTCAFLDQDNFPSNSLFVSVLSTIVMIGMFFMMTYATNSMSTDLVTTEKPITVTTYDQVIERNILTGYTKEIPEWERFASAPLGSKEWKLVQNSFPVSLTPSVALQLKDDVLNQKFVLIARPLVCLASALVNNGFPGWPKNGRFYVGPDPQAKKFTNASILNSKLKGTPTERFLSRMIGWMGEHGFAHVVQERSDVTIAKMFHGDNVGGLPSQQQLITSRIEEQSGEIVTIGWNHVYNVLIVLGSGLLSAAVVVLVELITATTRN